MPIENLNPKVQLREENRSSLIFDLINMFRNPNEELKDKNLLYSQLTYFAEFHIDEQQVIRWLHHNNWEDIAYHLVELYVYKRISEDMFRSWMNAVSTRKEYIEAVTKFQMNQRVKAAS